MTDYSDFALEEEDSKISRKSALKQVGLIIKKYRINLKIMDKKTRKATVNQLELITDSIMRGFLEVSIDKETAELEVTQFLENRSKGSTVEKLVYGEKESKAHIAMGEVENEFERIDAFMTSICKTTNAGIIISKLRLTDTDLKNALGALFL